MDMYNFLLRKNDYETEDYAYLLFYHPDKVLDNGDVVFNTDLVKMNIDVKNAEKIISDALECLSGPMPSASDECEYCGWVRECDL